MKNSTILNQLYQFPQTVFSLVEIMQFFSQEDEVSVRNSLSYYVRTKQLKRLRRGIYAKSKYNPREMANKIYTPSYLSFNTILLDGGLIFQYDSTLYSAAYLSRELTIDNQCLFYHKLHPEIIANPAGIIKQDQVNIATLERAFLDMIYLLGDFYFDNLRPLNWDKVFELVPIYQQKAVLRRAKKQYQFFQELQP